MQTYRGPSGVRYHLDEEGSLECDVSFTIHTYTPDEEDVTISMRDVLFLAARHIQRVRGGELDMASDMEILGLEDQE